MKRPGDPRVAVGYVRVSKAEQELSPDAQRAAIEVWASRNGVRVTAVFEDRGVRSVTPPEDRPGLMAALRFARQDGAGFLVALRRDRLARDVVIAATIETLARDAGARVVTADGIAPEDTPEGRLMRTMLDAFGEYERALTRARTKAALAVKRARGLRYTGRAPLGFRFDGERQVTDKDEGDLLARVREMRTRRVSMARIAATLNDEGVAVRGGRVHVTTLARALRRTA